MELKLLEKEFTGIGEVKGFNFTQLYNSDYAYIYKVESTNTNYEVFEKKNGPLCINFEKRIYSETEFKEIYPKSTSFGVWAWTFESISEAMDKANDIEDRMIDKIMDSQE